MTPTENMAVEKAAKRYLGGAGQRNLLELSEIRHSSTLEMAPRPLQK